MSVITTHVLDVSLGRPAEGIPVLLETAPVGGNWSPLASGTTDTDGRVHNLLQPHEPVGVGQYRLTFDTAAYFRRLGVEGFYPEVRIVFEIRDPSQHYHVPLLLSPYSYSTYRGS